MPNPPIVPISKLLRDTLENNPLNTGLSIPRRPTAERPVNPPDGMLAYNTDTDQIEMAVNGSWTAFAAALGAILTAIQGLSSNGLICSTSSGGSAAVRTLTGTGSQIGVTNGTGASGNPTVKLADNPVVPGTGGLTLPSGTTAQQAGAAGTIRFNSQTSVFEGTKDGTAWVVLNTTP